MKLSEKEIAYLRANIERQDAPSIGTLLLVLNSRRGTSEQISESNLLAEIQKLETDFNDRNSLADSQEHEDEAPDQTPALKGTTKVTADGTYSTREKDAASARRAKQLAENASRANQDYLLSQIAILLEPPEVIEYKVLEGKTRAVLDGNVNQHLKKGWHLWGGVAAAAFGISPIGGNQFVQAIVKYKKRKP